MTVQTLNIAGARTVPIIVEQEPDGWWIARGRLSPRHCEEQAAGIEPDRAISRLARKHSIWSH